MDPMQVTISLDTIHCTDEGDGIGSAEPYLWTVFFKIDGDTVHVANSLMLEGTATIVTTPGNHGNLGTVDVDAGDDVPIPPEIGFFTTTLTPIPIDSGGSAAGVIGCAVILMEQDSTSDSAVAAGHEALNQAVQDALDDVIPTLNFLHQSPTDDEIRVLSDKVSQRVSDAISDGVSIWDWLEVAGDMDDKIGSSVFYCSQTTLCQSLYAGVPLVSDWDDEGRWQLHGAITTPIDDVEVSGIHKPSGRDDAHHIDQLGGTYNGADWRLTQTDVIRYIQGGRRFHVSGADRSRSQVEVHQHWVSHANPTGLFLTTSPDGSTEDNLLSLPALPLIS